jgi:hypothetical protein
LDGATFAVSVGVALLDLISFEQQGLILLRRRGRGNGPFLPGGVGRPEWRDAAHQRPAQD